MSVNLNKEELQAVAECVQTAWQNGAVKPPTFAHHLLTASQKLGNEFERLVGQEVPVNNSAPVETEKNIEEENSTKRNVPVDSAV